MADRSADTSNTQIPQFSERWELKAKLGVGGMGVVYKGYDKVLKKDVAVKLLMPGIGKDAIIRFQKEAKTAAKLDHPNIVKVLDFGVSESGDLYLIMDYIEGQSLDYHLKKSGPFDLKRTLDIFDQICQGLQHAHAHEVLHRDIKPSNIMLSVDSDGNYNVRVVDFGLAKLESDEQKLTSTGVRIGTPVYMSPEQARGEEVDHRSDIYSMGCLMFAALTGKPPLRGESYLETISMQIETEAPRLNSMFEQPKFTTGLEDIVATTLSKDPEERFQTMEELRTALSSVEELRLDKAGMPIDDRPKEQWWKDRKRLKLIAASVGIVILAVGVQTLYSLGYLQLPKPEFKELKYETTPEEGKWLIARGKVHDGVIKLIPDCKDNENLIILDPNFDDSDLKYLVGTKLETLDLSHTKVTDAGVAELTSFKTLKSLILNDNKNITDQSIDSILKMRKLKILSLKNTRVTDEGVSKLAKMKSLIFLDLAGLKKVTGRSFLAVREAPSLVAIRINGSGITRADLQTLPAWERLVAISTSDFGLQDDDMDVFAKTNLRHIDLHGNKDITLKGVLKLANLQILTIDLRGCSLTAQDIHSIEDGFTTTCTILSDHEEILLSTRTLPPGADGDLIRRWYHPSFLIVLYGPDSATKLLERDTRKQIRKLNLP